MKIFTLGGGGYTICFDYKLDAWWQTLAGKEDPRIGVIPTATGDSLHAVDQFRRNIQKNAPEIRLFQREEVDLDRALAQCDIWYVFGGNTASLLAVWRAHGLDKAIRRAGDKGIVFGGTSAGMLCWGRGGTTDSFGGHDLITDGLGMLDYSFSPHHDTEPWRDGVFREAINNDVIPNGFATDNGVGMLFENGRLVDTVTERPWAKATHILKGTGTPLALRRL